MSSRLYANNGRKSLLPTVEPGKKSEDVFLMDLEGKIDTLKNVSTDLHSELRNSKSRMDTLRGGFDEAQGHVNERLSNMSQLMKNKKGAVAMSKIVFLTTGILSVLYVIIKITLKRKRG